MDPGRDAKARAALGALEGLYRSAEDLAGEAARRAPLDEGTLRGSAIVVLTVNGQRLDGAGALALARRLVVDLVHSTGRAPELKAEVAFAMPYAAQQHERLDFHHAEGGPKYLEGPLVERAERYGRIIALASALQIGKP